MSTKFKIGISILVLMVSFGAIAVAWAPLLVTYVPLDQSSVHNIPSDLARVFEKVIHNRNSLQSEAMVASSILIALNAVISLVLVWRFKKI